MLTIMFHPTVVVFELARRGAARREAPCTCILLVFQINPSQGHQVRVTLSAWSYMQKDVYFYVNSQPLSIVIIE